MKFGIPWICLVLGYCTSSWQASTDNRGLAVINQWSQLEFEYSSDSARRQAISSGEFNPEHTVPIDVDVFYTASNNNKIFVTIPRFQTGVPATLGTITDKKFNGNPIIAPYPNWRWHQHPERCLRDRMVSVFRVKLDECGRLWVLDNGRLVDKQTCPAQLTAFDANTNEVLHRYEIPDSLMESTSLLVTLSVDVRDRECRDTFVYIADCQVPALIVYDVKRTRSWKILDKTFYPYPNFGTFNILGESFDLMDGILGMDLSPYKPGEDRTFFYHALSSGTENWAFTKDIRNQSLFASDNTAPRVFHTYPNKRHSQAAAMAIDRNGVAYFGQVSDTSISCWNTNTLYKEDNIDELSRDPVTMQFPSGVKVITNTRGTQELWFLTMRIQKVYTGTLNTRDINFRIHAARTDDLLRHSKCRHGQNFNNIGQGNLEGYLPPLGGGGYGLARNSSKRSQDIIQFPNV